MEKLLFEIETSGGPKDLHKPDKKPAFTPAT